MARIFCADDIDRALERELTMREKMNTPAEQARAAARCNRRRAMLKMVERGRDKAHAKQRAKGNASDIQNTANDAATGSEVGSSAKSA